MKTLDFIEQNELIISKRLKNILTLANDNYPFIKDITPKILSKFRNTGPKTQEEFIMLKKNKPKISFELDNDFVLKPIENTTKEVNEKISVQDFCRSNNLSFEEYDLIKQIVYCNLTLKNKCDLMQLKRMVIDYSETHNYDYK